jgi:galactose-1-phosphate uridylyltransferase
VLINCSPRKLKKIIQSLRLFFNSQIQDWGCVFSWAECEAEDNLYIKNKHNCQFGRFHHSYMYNVLCIPWNPAPFRMLALSKTGEGAYMWDRNVSAWQPLATVWLMSHGHMNFLWLFDGENKIIHSWLAYGLDSNIYILQSEKGEGLYICEENVGIWAKSAGGG